MHVVADPVREAMRAGIKVGLRLPWLYFVARTITLDEAFVVRRGVPGLSFCRRERRAAAQSARAAGRPQREELARTLAAAGGG